MDMFETDSYTSTASLNQSTSSVRARTRISETPANRKVEHAFTTQIGPVRSKDWRGPRTITLPRDANNGYGFTLRYFVVYPPPCVYRGDGNEQESYWSDFEFDDKEAEETRPEPLDTFFVKYVQPGGVADSAGLSEGDRIVSINGNLIGGKSYKDVVDLIQSCSGDLKLGVVPRDEDILQLAYQEYVYDGASLGYTEGLEHVAHDFDMHQPSVNKWSTPIVGLQRKPIKDENANNEDMQAKMKKYDPCVSFQAGTPIISSEMKFSVTVKTSRSNSNSSSGNSTPGRGLSGSSSPPSRRKKSSNSNSIPEPCVTFVSGRPVISSAEETVDQIDSTGVSASSLNYALKRQLNSSSETESTRRPKGKMPSSKQPYDKEAREVASLGMVSRLKDTFNDDQSKRSAISVLREDFRDQPGSPESDIENGEVSPESRFHLSINVSEGKGQMQRPNRTYSRNLISRSQRGRVGNLSSLTSQATLIESKAGNRLPMSPVGPRRGGSIHSNSVSSVTPVSGKGNVTRNKIRRVSEDKDSRIGFVVASGDGSQRVVGLPITLTHGPRPTKVSSSSDLSDDDSAVEYGKEESASADEGPSDSINSLNWRGNRRVSYLMATSSSTATPMAHKLSDTTVDADDEDSDALNNSRRLQRQLSEESVDDEAEDMRNLPITREGPLNKKLVQSPDGRKKISQRTWKAFYAVLRGYYLYCYKDKNALGSSVYEEDQVQPINIRGSVVDIAHDYVKRKHVFRLALQSGSEYLFQAEDTQCLMAWVNSLRDNNPDKDLATEEVIKTLSMLSAVNRQLEERTNGSASEDLIVKRMKSYENDASVPGSSPPGNKTNTMRKGLTLKKTHFLIGRSSAKKRALINVQVPVPGRDKESPPGITFGIPLDKCPQGKVYKNVPLILEHCCRVAEEKGLDCIGIYRLWFDNSRANCCQSRLTARARDGVPGNAAAVQALQEELDTKEPDAVNFEEEKWYDLNNITSLLKSFLRKLPEPIIPSEMYCKFIAANREEDSNDRLKALRFQVRNLPEYHFETLRFLVMHLKQVADSQEKNKMDPKNLAIVFGPSIVRRIDENMVSMVKDMSDQCRIIETLIHQAEWMFAEDGEDDVVLESVKNTMDESAGMNVVTSKGLLESMCHMAEAYEASLPASQLNCIDLKNCSRPQTADESIESTIKGGTVIEQTSKSKDGKQTVGAAIMSLANFTTNLSLKLRNKAGSPVFSKKGNKQELSSPFSEGEASDTADDPNTTSPKPRRRVSDPQMPRTKSDTTDFNRKFRSEGEDEDEVPVIKPKPKYPKYVRALGPMPSGKSKHSKSDDKKNTTDNEPDTTVTFQLPVNATIEIGGKEDASKKDFNFDAYKAAMLSEKTRMRLQKVTMEHQAATEKLQADKERIEREHERTLQDIRRDEDEDSLPSPLPPRDSDESMSTASESTNSSRKQSIDSITIPLAQRGFQVRQISSGSGSSEDKPGYALSAAEREQREREQKQLDLFLGQFELDSESAKQSQKSPTSDISDLSPSSLRDWKQMNMKGPVSPSVYSLGAKSLDEKLRILLDPSFQAREGKFIRSPTSPTSETSTEVSQDHGVDVGSGAISRFPEDRRTHFAPIRSIEKPYKTKVIGLNTARIYNADMIARMDTFNQKKQELEKKVSSILQESSKTKDIYYSDSNKTDEQKVASLRRQQQSQKPPNIHIPNTTQRVIVSATDLSPRQQAEFTYSTAENTDVSHDRLDRNVQHVVELLQDSHVEGATTNTSADITSLLSTLKRPRIDPNTECRAIDSSSSRVLRRTEDDERNIEFRNRPPNTQSDSQSGSSRREYDHTQAQGWRPGPPSLSGINSDFKYNNLYSR